MNAKFQKNEKDFEFLIKKRLEQKKNEYFPSSEAKEKKITYLNCSKKTKMMI